MSLIYAQLGLKAVSAASQFGAAKHQATMEGINRRYQETMSGISAAMQSNTLTRNEVSAKDALVRASTALQVQSKQDMAMSEASAAAAGVSGGSVTGTMRGLMRSRLNATATLRKKQEAQAKVNTSNRQQLQLSRIMNKDVSPIAQPSIASSLLGMGASMIDIYDSHQPEGQRTSDAIESYTQKWAK